MKFNIQPKIKKTLKTMFVAAFISASFLNTISTEAAYQIANASYILASGDYASKTNALMDIAKNTQKVIADTSKIQKVSNIRIFLNGQETTFEDGVLNYNGNTYLPLRNFGDLINANVQWNTNKKAAEITINDITLAIPNQQKLYVTNATGESLKRYEIFEITGADGSVIPSINYNDRIYLPMRFICEFFGYTVDYTQNNSLTNSQTIEIYQGSKPTLQLGTTYTKEETWRPQGVTVGTEEDWEKFYTQKHPVTGATPIPGVYYISSFNGQNIFTPIFDHTGDGRVGRVDVPTTDSNDKVILVNKTVTISELATMSDSEKSTYAKYECLEWYKQSVINTKPTTPGTTNGEQTSDTNWEWLSSINQWVAGTNITVEGQKVWTSAGQIGILCGTGNIYID